MQDQDAPLPVSPTSERSLGKVDQSFYLIGVGASAGGLDAIKQMISQVPAGFPHSLVIVQHISPDYKSLMSEILGRETSLPVQEVADDMPIEAGRIYLIPPRSNIVIQGTTADKADRIDHTGAQAAHAGLRFSLVDQTPKPTLNLPIDLFFHSLSEAVADRSIAVILSGSGSDGSRGLRAVKDREGFVIVQDPNMAAFDGMPRSAIATGIVDMILPPDSIVGEIVRYVEMRESGIDNVDRVFAGAEDTFTELLKLVSARADLDFRLYKEPTLKRRVARRMALQGYKSVETYLERLRRDSAELNVLYREFLVGVTNFFRDRPIWTHLRNTVLEDLFRHGSEEEPVRVWSVGCSTGEEAYTIAMVLEEYRAANGISRDFRVFATDVNQAAIQAAKQGVYPDSVRDEIPDVYMARGYISFQAGTFTIAPSIRNRIVFSVHNVMEDAPFTRTDLIVCRNLLIYLGPDVQAKIMTHFSFSLRQDGILQLGAAETPGQHGTSFEPLAHKMRIYRNIRRVKSNFQRMTRTMEFHTAPFLPRTRRMGARSHTPGDDITAMLQYALHDCDSVICITDDLAKVIRTFGDHGDLLNIPSTGFSASLLELVDERLRSSLALVMREAETDGQATKSGVRVIGEDAVQVIDITCRKVPWENHSLAFAVTFRRHPEAPTAPEGPVAEDAPSLPSQAYIQHLESEVRSLQDMLSATAEDLGASNEELQTTNEELIASNEELQANNEETQSINEELHTLNAENADKIAELEAATGDIKNLLATADLAVLLLDNQLCIRQFSASIDRYVRLEQSDIGRPLENFAVMLDNPSLVTLLDDIRLCRDSGTESTRDLRARDSGFVFCRVRPYRNVHGQRHGVVVAMTDTTEIRLLEQEVRQQRDRLEGLLESEAAGYWDWNIPTGQLFMSPRFKAMFGYAADEVENTLEGRDALIHPDDLQATRDAFEEHVASQGRARFDVEKRYIHRDGSIVWVISRGRVLSWSETNQPLRMMGVHIDITRQKQRELEVRERAAELRRFAFIAAHDLMQPMNTIEGSIAVLREDLPANMMEDQEQILDFLTTSTERMKGRIHGILDFSRLQDSDFDFVPVDLGEVVRSCLEDIAVMVQMAEARVTVGDLPTVLGSKNLALRVVQNLVSNALKYRDKTRPCQITITEAAAPKGMVAFSVTDNGIGIPPEHRKKVFELFSRLHTEEEYAGNGLGLALSERIVTQLEGEIEITDGQDGGTTVTVTLKAG